MQEVKTKKAKKSFFLRLAVFVFICYVAVMLVNQQMQISEKQKALDDLNQAIKIQELQNNQLRDVLNSKDGNQEYIERIARGDLDLANPGERVFINIAGN